MYICTYFINKHLLFFIQHSDEKMAQQKSGDDGYWKKPITKVSIVLNTIKHLQTFLNILKYIIYVTLINIFNFTGQ